MQRETWKTQLPNEVYTTYLFDDHGFITGAVAKSEGEKDLKAESIAEAQDWLEYDKRNGEKIENGA